MVKETKECSQLPLSVQDKGHSRISELLPKDFIKRQLRMIPYQHSRFVTVNFIADVDCLYVVSIYCYLLIAILYLIQYSSYTMI